MSQHNSDKIGSLIRSIVNDGLNPHGYYVTWMSDIMGLPSLWSGGTTMDEKHHSLLCVAQVSLWHERFGGNSLVAQLVIPLGFLTDFLRTGDKAGIEQGVLSFCSTVCNYKTPDEKPLVETPPKPKLITLD